MKFTLQNSTWRIKKLYESGGAFSEKIQQKDERGKEVGFQWKSYGETIIDRGVSWERRYRRLNQHRSSNSKTTRLQKISGKKRWSALKRPRNAIRTKVELFQNVIEPLVGFLREKTATDRYVQNNRNRKVNSKWWKLWWFSSNTEWIMHFWMLRKATYSA